MCSQNPLALSELVITQSPSRVRLFVTPWTTTCQASLSLTISWSLPKFMSTESVMPSNHLNLCLLLLLLPSIFPASGSSPMSQLFTSGGQSIGVSASVLPMSIQDWTLGTVFTTHDRLEHIDGLMGEGYAGGGGALVDCRLASLS